MSELYKELAKVYEAMYQTFIDYQEEYNYYSSILKKYDKKKLLEIGSGTGHLAQQFVENGYDYIGLDYNQEMIEIAKKREHQCQFIHGDMTSFKLEKSVDAIIIPSRTISYLTQHKEITAFAFMKKRKRKRSETSRTSLKN